MKGSPRICCGLFGTSQYWAAASEAGRQATYPEWQARVEALNAQLAHGLAVAIGAPQDVKVRPKVKGLAANGVGNGGQRVNVAAVRRDVADGLEEGTNGRGRARQHRGAGVHHQGTLGAHTQGLATNANRVARNEPVAQQGLQWVHADAEDVTSVVPARSVV